MLLLAPDVVVVNKLTLPPVSEFKALASLVNPATGRDTYAKDLLKWGIISFATTFLLNVWVTGFIGPHMSLV